MKDETYLFISDCRDKKNIARSARNKRTHNGKGGRVKLPSDYMTKKELKAMNGEVKSYRLNEPMSWKEFKAMPDDIKVTYIKLLREKFNCFDTAIAEIMGVNKATFSIEIKRLGLGHGEKHGGRRTWNERDAFYAWASGAKVVAEQPEEPIPEGPVAEESVDEWHEIPKEEVARIAFGNPAIPCQGNLTFEGNVEDILKSVRMILGNSNVRINICWQQS